jgi:Protein phosphatase 2C
MRLPRRPWLRRPVDEQAPPAVALAAPAPTSVLPVPDADPTLAEPAEFRASDGPLSPTAPPAGLPAVLPAASREAESPPAPTGPVDLPTDAPCIGRVGDVQQGHVEPGTALRPPAVTLDGTAAGAFQVAAASLIGVGHLQSGRPRQDAYNFMASRSGLLYVAIADGLGSKAASQLGSHLFIESVLVAAAHAEADEDGARSDPARLLTRASARMARIVTDAYHIDPNTVGCVGAVAVFSDKGCAIARVGDVSAFTIAEGDFTEVFPAEAGLVNIVSAAMPGEDESDVETVDLPPAPVVVFGTDGLANDIRNSGALREWLAGRWCLPHLPFAIGNTLRYRRQGSHDDRTAVLVWRSGIDPDPVRAGNDQD